MPTKIGLISDPHAAPEPVREALSIFQTEGVDTIICAGDIAGYNDELEQTIGLLIDNKIPTIIGNHDHNYLETHREEQETKHYQFLNDLPVILEYSIEGKSVYVVHAQPPDSQHGGIKLLDIEGNVLPDRKQLWSQQLAGFESDILIVGHTHQVFAELLGDVFVINPGSTVYNHSCAILSLPDMTVQFFGLSNKTLLKLWNWEMFLKTQNDR